VIELNAITRVGQYLDNQTFELQKLFFRHAAIPSEPVWQAQAAAQAQPLCPPLSFRLPSCRPPLCRAEAPSVVPSSLERRGPGRDIPSSREPRPWLALPF